MVCFTLFCVIMFITVHSYIDFWLSFSDGIKPEFELSEFEPISETCDFFELGRISALKQEAINLSQLAIGRSEFLKFLKFWLLLVRVLHS